jgi:hypothetical protein
VKTKAFRREQARVEGYVTRWQTAIGLGYWRVDRCYYQTSAQFREATDERAEDCAVMVAQPDWRYSQCTIHVDCESTARLTDWYLEQDVVHELVHCHLDELRWAVSGDGEVSEELHNHIEHVTETVARALVWARDGIDGKETGGTPAEEGRRDAGRGDT